MLKAVTEIGAYLKVFIRVNEFLNITPRTARWVVLNPIF